MAPSIRWNRARSARAAVGAALLGVGLLSVVPAAVAGSSGVKEVAVAISPSPVSGGASAAYSISLTNEASPQSLGSANVTPPAGFVVSSLEPASAGSIVNGVVELRNLSLAPGASVVVNVEASAPSTCTQVVATWGVLAKQANDFNGPPGNNFTLDSASNLSTTVNGSCHLKFVTQPADAVINTPITTAPFTSGASAVTIEVLDSNNNVVPTFTGTITLNLSDSSPNKPAGAALSGGVATASQGLASFPGLSINDHGVYILLATSPGVAPILGLSSGAFNIWDADGSCATGQPCSASSSLKNSMNTEIQGVAGAGGFLSVALGEDQLSCGDKSNHAPSVTTFSTFGYDQPATVTLTILKSALKAYPNSGLSFWAVCYGSSSEFVTNALMPAPLAPNGLYTGLLPSCNSVNGAAPCVESISKDPADDIIEAVKVPPGDPRMG